MEVPEDKVKFSLNQEFWEARYQSNETGWDIGYCSTPLKAYFEQLEDKQLHILIPGCGNAYEAEFLHNLGFKNIYLIDLAPTALKRFSERLPDFPEDHLIAGDFFELKQKFDLIIEQTFFCAIHPSKRPNYAKQCKELLKNNGKIVGLLFDAPLNEEHPPFGGSKQEYLSYFKPYFTIGIMESASNSIEPRKGRELFIKLIRKK